MTERKTHHATFTIERNYPASPDRVFNAWADPASKLQWFACHEGWRSEGHLLEFRPGGRERLDSYPEGSTEVHAYSALYYDIVPQQRIVYAYDMHLGETRISVSLATIEFEPAGDGTRMTFTEQVVMLDEYDGVEDREAGTRAGLENLGKWLSR